jgi:2-methylcitrate dehydratase PrpD
LTLSTQLADWLAELRYDDLPTEVTEDAALRVLDTLGVALAAVDLPLGRAVRATAATLGSGDEAGLIGGGRSTAALAALVNGTLAHALDFDDTHAGSVMHPSAPACALALAVNEASGGSGRDLLLDVTAGIELNCRLGLVAPGAFHAVGQHPTGVLGAIAAALVAARRFGLDRHGLAMAAGIAGSQASGILEAYSDGSWSKTLHPGWAAHCGIAAARLAQAGFTGPLSALDGRYGVFRSHLPAPQELCFDSATAAIGDHWCMLDTACKLYPCAHAIHAFVEAALVLRQRHGLDPADIASVCLIIPPGFADQIAEPRAAKLKPLTPTHARASAFFAVAAALIDGRLGLDHYTDEAIRRADILALAERMSWREGSNETPIRFSGTLTLTTRDGGTSEHAVADTEGTGSRRLDRAAFEAKFRVTAGIALGGEAVERLIAMCRSLPGLGTVAPLLAATRVAPA